MPKPPRRPVQRKANEPKRLVRIPALLTPAQAAALDREARRRKAARGRGRSDVSEVLRDAVSVWMAIRPGQRALIGGVAARHDLTRPEVLRQALDAWLTSLDPGDV